MIPSALSPSNTVTTVTPVAKCPITSRNVSELNSIGAV